MLKRPSLPHVANIMGNPRAAAKRLNDNFTILADALERCLWRDGTAPNEMAVDLDLNGNTMLNTVIEELPEPPPPPVVVPPLAVTLSGEAVENTHVLSWTAATGYENGILGGYRIYNALTDVLLATTGALEHTLTVGYETSGSYYVVAFLVTGEVSPPSNTVMLETGENPGIDEFWADTVLLLQVDAGGNLVERTGVPDSVTVVGAGTVTSAQQLFGRNTFDNPGTDTQFTNYIRARANPGTPYQFAGPFTYEGWFYVDALNTVYTGLLGHPQGANNTGIFHQSSNGGGLVVTVDVGGFNSDTFDMTTGEWHHVALTRDGASVLRLFVDGVQVGTGSNSATFGNPIGGNSDFIVGAGWELNDDNADINGHFSEIRVTKGVARYTANFTPPTTFFPMAGP